MANKSSAIKNSVFKGILPIFDTTLLKSEYAQKAENLVIESGKITAFKAPLYVQDVPAGTKSIFKYNGSWLSWTTDVNVCNGPIVDDSYKRIYLTGDGVPKVRGISSGSEITYPLGIPAPTTAPTIAISQAAATSWTRTWKYFYEEPDGAQKDAGSLTTTEVTPGKEYTATIPAKVTASPSAVFIAWFEAYSGTTLLGRSYPTTSLYSDNNDLFINGAKVEINQVNSGGTATMTITYNSSEATNYTVYKTWLYTFVSIFGEESAPSPASSVTAMDPTQQADLSAMDTTAPAGYAGYITKKYIYRSVTGESGTVYKYMGEVSLATSTYTDNKTDADAGGSLLTVGWLPPPSDLKSIIAMPGGFLMGLSGKTVCMSVPGYPHAWPLAYQQNMEYEGISCRPSGTSAVIATKGMPYVATAPDPENMTLLKISTLHGGQSLMGIVEYMGAIFYSGAEGLVNVTGGTSVLTTGAYISKEQWTAYGPTSMRFGLYDDRLYIFSDNASLYINVLEKDLEIITLNLGAAVKAVHHIIETDSMFVVYGDKLYEWDADPVNVLTWTWRSPDVIYQIPVSHNVGRVLADVYPITMNIYTNNVLKATVSITKETARRLPIIRPERRWSYEITGSTRVIEALISPSMGDL